MDWEQEKEQLGRELTHALYDNGMIMTWYRDKPDCWTLQSGQRSILYINLRLIGSFPDVLERAGYAMGRMIKEEIPQVDRIVGVAMAGVPLAVATGLSCGIPVCYNAKLRGVRTVEDLLMEIEKYGAHSLVEGVIESGDNILLLDDLVTTLRSKEIAREQVLQEVKGRGLSEVSCDNVGVLFDREQGAQERAQKIGIGLYSLIPFATKGLDWLRDEMEPIEYDAIGDSLRGGGRYQLEELIEIAREARR